MSKNKTDRQYNEEYLIGHLFGLVYEDDGPSGICGQSVDITIPWKKLYLFDDEEVMHNFTQKIRDCKGKCGGRRNVRVTGIFYPNPISDDVKYIKEWYNNE